MSYDLALFSTKVGTTNEEVAAYYVTCCEGEVLDASADRALECAFAEISECYPDLDALSDDQVDDSPWSCGFEKGPRHLFMYMRWSRSEDMSEFISQVAGKHDVILFDPQGSDSFRGKKKLPSSAKKSRPWWKIW
jgi:hypothetical protein